MTLVIHNVMDQVRTLAEFFHERPERVNQLLLRLAIDERPEWLRDRPKLVDLPRYLPGCEHQATITHKKPKELGQQIKWIVEQMHGQWCLTTDGFYFDDPKEAVFYRLMWG